MKTSFGRPTAEQMGSVRVPWLQDNNPPPAPAEPRTLAGSVVLIVQRDSNRRDDSRTESARSPSGQLATIASLGAEERLLLGLIDGRLSVARLARLSGLSEDAAARHLQALCAKGLAARAPTNEVTIEGRGGEPFFKLGAYEVAGRVGQGGMGSVYVCRRTSASGFRKLFALKVVRQGSGQESFALRTLVRELKVGQMLSHPNVQSVVDVGTYKDQPFLVLDYVEGTDLEELVASCGGPLPPALVVTVMLDMLRGMQRAHDTVNDQGDWLGLVHADVSPPNVLIGIDGVTRLADFGSARFTAAGEAESNEPFKLGKPAYMAPEQFLGEPLDARTDLFAAGIVMWTALTGRDLFSAESYEEIVRNVQSREIDRPSLHGAPACLDQVCLRALSRRRDVRYVSADDMATDLMRVAAAEGLLATSKQVGEYVQRQLGEALVERRRQIEERLRGYRASATPPAIVTGAPASVPGAAASVDSIPAVVRRATTAPTVVMPDRQTPPPVATKRRSARRGATRFEVYLTVALGALAFSLVVLVFTRGPRQKAANTRTVTSLSAPPAARAAPPPPVRAGAAANATLPQPTDSGGARR